MVNKIYNISKKDEYMAAGQSDLIAMVPVPGQNQLFIQKYILEILAVGIYRREFIHVSGPTGSAKSSLIEALTRQEDNFSLLCKYLDIPFERIRIFEIEMALFDTPAELYQRRSLKNGETYDEASPLVVAMKEGMKAKKDEIPLIFLKEMGRVHTAAIQGGLLNLMTRSDVILPNQNRIPGGKIGFIADSNYQAVDDAQHTLVTFDEALKRRFTINVLMGYLSEPEELAITEHLLKKDNARVKIDEDLLRKIIHLGSTIRDYRSQGNLLSVVPPTIYGYLTVYRMVKYLPSIDIPVIISNTLLGNASDEDQRMIDTLIQNVFKTARSSKTKSMFEELF